MMAKRKLRVITSVNFLRAYGGVKYLSQCLAEQDFEIEIHAPIPYEALNELENPPFTVHTLPPAWYGRIPKIRGLYFRASILFKGLSENTPLLLSEYFFLREAVAIKKAKPHLPLIHYCQELATPEEHPNLRGVHFYARHANVPDLIVDVEPHRAAKRRERFNLTKEILVLPNTLPLSEIPAPAPKGTLAQLAGGGIPMNLPILVYTGGVHSCISFDTILEALESLTEPLFFLGFCHGPSSKIEWLRRQVNQRLGEKRGRICDAVPRHTLLSCLHEADAGLVYYSYSAERSTNQLYAAPSKVYEYIALGLPVLSSANPSLVDLIEGRSLGVCASNDSAEALKVAIEKLFARPNELREIRARAPKIFREELSFEQVAPPVVARITALLNQYGRQ